MGEPVFFSAQASQPVCKTQAGRHGTLIRPSASEPVLPAEVREPTGAGRDQDPYRGQDPRRLEHRKTAEPERHSWGPEHSSSEPGPEHKPAREPHRPEPEQRTPEPEHSSSEPERSKRPERHNRSLHCSHIHSDDGGDGDGDGDGRIRSCYSRNRHRNHRSHPPN